MARKIQRVRYLSKKDNFLATESVIRIHLHFSKPLKRRRQAAFTAFDVLQPDQILPAAREFARLVVNDQPEERIAPESFFIQPVIDPLGPFFRTDQPGVPEFVQVPGSVGLLDPQHLFDFTHA